MQPTKLELNKFSGPSETVIFHFYKAKDINGSAALGRWGGIKLWLKTCLLFGGRVYIAMEWRGDFYHTTRPHCMVLNRTIRGAEKVEYTLPDGKKPDIHDWAVGRPFTRWRTMSRFFLRLPQDLDKIINCTACCARAIHLDTHDMIVPDDLFRRLTNGNRDSIDPRIGLHWSGRRSTDREQQDGEESVEQSEEGCSGSAREGQTAGRESPITQTQGG